MGQNPESNYACRSEIRLEAERILSNVKSICLTETTVHSWLVPEFKNITLRIFWIGFLMPELLKSALSQV